MRSAWRTIAPARRQSMIVTALMVGVIGISYGATAVSSGFPLWFPVVLATTVVAGSSEFVLIGILAAGGGGPAEVAAGPLLHQRRRPYGRDTADLTKPRRRRTRARPPLLHRRAAPVPAARDTT